MTIEPKFCWCCNTELLTDKSKASGMCFMCRRYKCSDDYNYPTCNISNQPRWALRRIGP